MTWFMKAVHAVLPPREQDPLPPRQITERVTEEVAVKEQLSEEERRRLSVAAHYAFGATAGALYAPLARTLRLPAVLGGVTYGLGVWASSYLGWLPKAGLYRRPQHEPAGRQAMMIGAHVVWGAALGMLVGLTTRVFQEKA